MRYDNVDAVADAVESARFGLMVVRQFGQLPGFTAVKFGAVPLQAFQRCLQHQIVEEQVVAVELINLIIYFWDFPGHD